MFLSNLPNFGANFCSFSLLFYGISLTFCIFATFIPTPTGRWVRTTTYWEASLMLCFWLSETSTNDRPVKSNSRGECYGCSIYSRSVPRANYALMHTFGAYYIITGVGIQTLFVHWLGCGRPQIAGRAEEDTPLFVCCKWKRMESSDARVSVGEINR